MRFLFILFIAMPIVEMFVLFKVAEGIGALTTVALVVLTAFVGINILRQQGFSTLTRANQRLNAGQLPAQEILEGFCLAIGGALLLTPGFITDTIGFLLLIPPTRQALVRYLIKSGRVRMMGAGSSGGFYYQAGRSGERPRHTDQDDVYEGEFTREAPPAQRIDDDNDPDGPTRS